MSTSVTITWEEKVIKTASFDTTDFYPGMWTPRSVVLQRTPIPGTEGEVRREVDIIGVYGQIPGGWRRTD